MITHDTAVGAPPPPEPLCRGPGSHCRDPLGTPRPSTRPWACGPWAGSAGVWAPDPRGSRAELAKNRQFLTPCGAKSWGSGGAPPTNLILLRNQRRRLGCCAPPTSDARAGGSGAVAGVGRGSRGPPGPTHETTSSWSGARPGKIMAPCAGKGSPPLRYRSTAARRQVCLALPGCSGRVKGRWQNHRFLPTAPCGTAASVGLSAGSLGSPPLMTPTKSDPPSVCRRDEPVAGTLLSITPPRRSVGSQATPPSLRI